MQLILLKPKKYFILSFFVLYFIGGQPAEFGQEYEFFQGFLIQKPIIRVALGVNLSHIQVSSSSGMKVYQVDGSYKLLADNASEVQVKGNKEKLTEKFVIQVAQAKEREEAEKIAQDLATKIENRVSVSEDKESRLDGMFQVKVGDFLTREDALEFIKKLDSVGVKDAWILKEEITQNQAKPLWILLNDELVNLSQDTALYFIPESSHSYLSFGGRNYRGIFVLKASRKGIVLVNILNLEEYLKGVVPGELSPHNFAELEAQKAQAVASRTYALKNIGLNNDLGFDLVDTPSSQVYRGISVEHPLSSQAVDMTRGEVAFFNAELINALYTSTCGGMTENVENIFEGNSLPYLRSTECIYEKEEEWVVRSTHVLPYIQAAGKNISQKIAYLASLGVVPSEASFYYWRQTSSSEEVSAWIQNALALVGKRNEKFTAETTPLNFITLAQLIIDAFQWQERVKNLTLKSEADYVLKDFPHLTQEEKAKLAYFIVAGIFPRPFPEMGDKGRSLTRAEAAFYLEKVMATYKYFYHAGLVRGLGKNMIELIEGNERKQAAIPTNIFLIRDIEDQSVFLSSLELVGGENVRWVETNGEACLLEVVSSPNSNILDWPSQYHRWEQRISREDLEARINLYYPVGKLIDVVPQKRGESKRVIELKIIGTEGQVLVTGLKVRWVLGLRETLFVVDRQYDADGQVTHFIFSGKGWGHGVGLCQVGAYRLAQKGADYKEILKKYYQGITIDKIY